MKARWLAALAVVPWLLAATRAAAAAMAELTVIAAAGDVTFNGKAVKVGDVVEAPGTLKTGVDGSVKVFAREAKTLTILKPGSAVEFDPSQKTTLSFRLLEGLSRWVVGKIKPGQPVVVTTKTAVMGIRGTEFMATYNSTLDESQIVTFAGSVEFRRKDRPQAKHLIHAGQWGGIGGRYGDDVERIIDLPAAALARFGEDSELQTTLKDAVSSDEYHGHRVPK